MSEARRSRSKLQGKTMVKIYKGDIEAKPGQVYDYEEITGYVYARGADTKTAFPKLTTVGGYVDASGADTKTAFPKLTTVGGYVDASGADTKTAFPKLTTVGGSVYASGADTKTAFPKLTTVGGYVDARGAEHVKTDRAKAASVCAAALKASLAIFGLVLQDGILSEVVSRKGDVFKVKVVGKSKVSYVIERDGQTAHGETMQLARADLLFKLGKRDTSAFKSWKLNAEKPIEEMVAAYRAITGACGMGVQHFMSGKKYGTKVSVAFVLKETKGQYGHEQFSKFFAEAR